MIKIGILGDIGSGKSYVAQNFGYPVFNADYEVAQLYKKNKNIFNKLKAKLPEYICSFPIKKTEISNAILAKNNNLNKIVKIKGSTFYSDSINDLPLLQLVDNPVAVDPCPRLKEKAIDLDWKIISLRN